MAADHIRKYGLQRRITHGQDACRLTVRMRRGDGDENGLFHATVPGSAGALYGTSLCFAEERIGVL